MPYLDQINFPEDIRKLSIAELPALCAELREFIIAETAKNPGHLGASLGTIELTVAIHYVFDTPNDKLVWDVGHQAYCHKIVTGRKERFNTNRKYHGISGFPKMSESEYDAFGTGHSSTSISAVLGMAVSDRLTGNKTRKHIAVIGDGAIGGGMAFEAMNQAGASGEEILVILNDNKVAIDENVGAVSQYLLEITTSQQYNRFKDKLWQFFTFKKLKPNRITRFFSRMGNAIKGNIVKESNLFQQLGFRYFGPADGHDVQLLVKILSNLKNIENPKLLHIITTKGKGLYLAEQNQAAYHAPGTFDPDTGEIIELAKEGVPARYQEVFGETILELAQMDERVVGITPAMMTGCSLTIMRQHFPERVFDVGIAEQHAVTFSAGLAAVGHIPFCNIYSSFLQRGYDQIIHDVALQQLPVIFCIDRAGIVGEDGPTHQGVFDLAYLQNIPNLIIASPLHEIELRNLMFTAYKQRTAPFAIRYPRGHGILQNWKLPFEEIPIGKAELLKQGDKMAILSLGPIGNHVKKAIDELQKMGINPAHINVRFLKPFDKEMFKQVAEMYPILVTVEDGAEIGGLFSTVATFLAENNFKNELHHIAVPDKFIEHGDLQNLYQLLGFDVESMIISFKEWYQKI